MLFYPQSSAKLLASVLEADVALTTLKEKSSKGGRWTNIRSWEVMTMKAGQTLARRLMRVKLTVV